MNSTIERTETLDEQTTADLNSIEESVISNYTLADALREGSQSVKQVRHTFGAKEGEGCALTAIAVAAQKHGIEI